jgi:hypothetical protein
MKDDVHLTGIITYVDLIYLPGTVIKFEINLQYLSLF